MEGDPNRHDHYRQRICDFVERHEEDFAPFVEDDRTLAQVRFLSPVSPYCTLIGSVADMFSALYVLSQWNIARFGDET